MANNTTLFNETVTFENFDENGPRPRDPLEDLTGFYRAYFSPLIAVLGILGNILVIIVFSTDQVLSRFSIYCIMLAITHSIALLTNSLMDDFIGRGFAYVTNGDYFVKLDTSSNSMCKFMEYIPVVAYFGSSFIVALFSLDRALTIFNPLRYFSTYFKVQCWVGCCCVILIGALMACPSAIIHELNTESSDGVAGQNSKCEIIDNTSVLAHYSLQVNTILTFVVPTIIVFILNVIIIVKFQQVRRTRAALCNDTADHSQEMNRIMGHLAVGTAFLLVTIPLVVVIILRSIADDNHWAKEKRDVLKNLSRFFSSLKDLNYAVDFFLYFFFLPNFRWRTLRLILAPCRVNDCLSKTEFGAEIEANIARYDNKKK